ncbi:hypothetical protein IJ00_08185 [Calothrix sp. 336/3]|nr:hypothetical protein IJ00_08185 [Calothrix sp. 336/3]
MQYTLMPNERGHCILEVTTSFLLPMDILHLLTSITELIQQILHLRWLLHQMRISISRLIPQRYQKSRNLNTSALARKSQLIEILKGDTTKVEYLLSQQRKMHPKKSEEWYVEKVIINLSQRTKTIPPNNYPVVPIKQHQPYVNKHHEPTSIPFPTPRQHNAKTRELFGKLVRLLHGDSAAANRLVDAQRLKTPAKGEEWILEKVIHDLGRDRY